MVAANLLGETEQFLTQLEPAQDALLSLYERKKAAMVNAHSAEMLQIAEEEKQATFELQKMLSHREQILNKAQRSGFDVKTLSELAETSTADGRDKVLLRIERAHAKTQRIRRESWVQWIVAQRVLGHYAELLDVIAHSGEKSPTYSNVEQQNGNGGAILDASA